MSAAGLSSVFIVIKKTTWKRIFLSWQNVCMACSNFFVISTEYSSVSVGFSGMRFVFVCDGAKNRNNATIN